MPRSKKYSHAEPVTDLRHIKIVECGEPLVDYSSLSDRIVMGAARWRYTRATFLRQSVAEMLVVAADALPDGYKLGVIEGWRPRYIQHRMYVTAWQRWKNRHPEWSDVQLRRVVNRFTAPIHGRVPPPHSTGGALDVTLVGPDGKEVDHTSPFEPWDPKCYHADAEGLSETAKANRATLATALRTGGLTNYPSEWWHWSYGDQGWAYRTGANHAVYGPSEPHGWSGFPEDMTEDPLVRADTLTYR